MKVPQVVLGLVVALATGCSSSGSSPPSTTDAVTMVPRKVYTLAPRPTVSLAPGAPMPTKVPVPPGLVTIPHGASVWEIEPGRSRVCLGPQDLMRGAPCPGIDLIGLDWSDFPGALVGSDGRHYGSFDVVGRYDGKKLTVESATVHVYSGSPKRHRSTPRTPCAPPVGGWRIVDPDPKLATPASAGRVAQVARHLPGYAGFWIVHLGKSGDRRVRVVVNVAVTRSRTDAERALRKVWGGPLCVSSAKHSAYALMKIANKFSRLAGWRGTSSSEDHVVVDVTYDDGSLQAWADQKYGRGLVVVRSALLPVAD